eukprot:scaffold57771_cov41-Prasinocladus_malaysianus.AAC.1
MHCRAMLWGPLVPPNTGVLCLQNLQDSAAGWRISATGVVLELDASTKVVKKLKLVGHPIQVCMYTPQSRDVFPMPVCASALRPGQKGIKDGAFRATFEDKVIKSDVVFLRAWVCSAV